MCIDSLFERSSHVYMWTFTFPETLHAWLAAHSWLTLWQKLNNYYGRCSGVRVMEFHRDHGIHFHVLIDRRVSIDVVRRMCRQCGFGRVHVCEIRREDRYYVAKYVNKDRDMPQGLRRWASFGTKHKTRCRDLEMRSSVADAMRQAYAEAKSAGKPKGIAWAAMIKAKHEELLRVVEPEAEANVGESTSAGGIPRSTAARRESLSPCGDGSFASTVGGGDAEGCGHEGRCDTVAGVGGNGPRADALGEARGSFGGIYVHGITQCKS
jgi:hypothetical protein